MRKIQTFRAETADEIIPIWQEAARLTPPSNIRIFVTWDWFEELTHTHGFQKVDKTDSIGKGKWEIPLWSENRYGTWQGSGVYIIPPDLEDLFEGRPAAIFVAEVWREAHDYS